MTFEKNEPEVKSHAINIGEMKNGKVTATVEGKAVETAEEGAEVTLTVAPAKDYQLKEGTLAATYQVPGENATDEPKTEKVVLTPVEGKKGEYTFTMPTADVTVTAEFEQIPAAVTYKVEVAATLEHGDVKADKDSAAAGETVQLTVTPAPGYELEAIRVVYTGENGKEQEVTVEDNTFKMPAGDVVVSARFKKAEEPKPLHTVTVTVKDNQGGTATAPSQAAAGETVKLDIQPKDGWIVDKVTMNDELVDLADPMDKLSYQFEMPDKDAKVVVVFYNTEA